MPVRLIHVLASNYTLGTLLNLQDLNLVVEICQPYQILQIDILTAKEIGKKKNIADAKVKLAYVKTIYSPLKHVQQCDASFALLNIKEILQT